MRTILPSGSVSHPETAAARSTTSRIIGRAGASGAAASIARAACCHSETLTSWYAEDCSKLVPLRENASGASVLIRASAVEIQASRPSSRPARSTARFAISPWLWTL